MKSVSSSHSTLDRIVHHGRYLHFICCGSHRNRLKNSSQSVSGTLLSQYLQNHRAPESKWVKRFISPGHSSVNPQMLRNMRCTTLEELAFCPRTYFIAESRRASFCSLCRWPWACQTARSSVFHLDTSRFVRSADSLQNPEGWRSPAECRVPGWTWSFRSWWNQVVSSEFFTKKCPSRLLSVRQAAGTRQAGKLSGVSRCACFGKN